MTVGVITNCAPISCWNAEKSTCEGLAVEIFNTICKKTGLKVKYVPVDMSRIVQDKKTGDLPQLVLGIPLVDVVRNDKDCYLSDVLLEDPLAIVGKTGADLAWGDEKTTIAAVKDFVISHTYIEEKLPGSEIVEYPTLEDWTIVNKVDKKNKTKRDFL